jgi:predicted transcriptional regulator
VKDIAKLMRKEDVGAIPVRADGQLVGIVTDRDITCRALANSGDINRMTAKDVMTKKVVHCSPDDDLSAAIRKMELKKIRRLPVTNGHAGLVGMLSLGDVSHKVNKNLSGVARALRASPLTALTDFLEIDRDQGVAAPAGISCHDRRAEARLGKHSSETSRGADLPSDKPVYR